MSFFSAIAKSFTGAFGKQSAGGIQQMAGNLINKIKFWFVVTIFFWILYWILLLFQCSKPSSGEGACLLNNNNGTNKTFTYDMANLSSGGECGIGNPYDIKGQQIDWIDTGFETNGKQLIVYADGNYFPWGEKQTPKTFSYHVSTVKFDDGTTGDALNITTDYKECEMNTDINYSLMDDQATKVIYENQFNSYTSANSNNRKENKGKKLIDNNIQGDCIIGNNCSIGLSDEIQKACVLKNGAGIYMKIGTDSTFSYHIKNYFVPEYEINCISNDNCRYQYKTSNDGLVYNLIKVPYAIPPVIYKKGANTNGFIWDIKDNVIKNLQILKDYDKETNYKFYTLIPEPNNKSCVGDDYQKIGGLCYHSEQKKLSLLEIKNASCPVSSTENINLPNELCAPQSGKRIYIKPSDTCYEDNTGNINLTFVSGAKPVKENSFSYKNGLHITWVQSFISALFEPFFGNQNEDDTLKVTSNDSNITICRENDNKNEPIYFSNRGGNWLIKTEKYSFNGLKIKDNYNVSTVETLDVRYLSSLNQKCVVATIKSDFEPSKKISDYTTEEVKSTTITLFKLKNIEDGLFIKARNSIMSTSFYHSARILVIVWFVFSFGLGFVNKEKMLSLVPVITSDWKRFLILLWCTDPKNYDFIDRYLWSGLIYGAQAISSGIIDAVSDIYGSSIVVDESPMTFFDDIIASVTSKEVFYKIGAIATSSLSFVFFLFLFPFLANGIIDFMLAVIGPIVSLGFTMFNLGSIIMFMPLYALISMFGGKEEDKFFIAMKTLVKEFIHFAFSVGFFGLCIGFIYHYFMEVIDVKVCWRSKFEFNFFSLININLYDWQLCLAGSENEADIVDRFKIIWEMVKSTFKFTMVLAIFSKLSIIISEQLANIFSQGGGSMGLKAAGDIFNSVKEVVATAFTDSNSALEYEKKYANNMRKKQNEESDVKRDGVDFKDDNMYKNAGSSSVNRTSEDGNSQANRQMDDVNNEQNNNDLLNRINKEDKTTKDNDLSVDENINIPNRSGLDIGPKDLVGNGPINKTNKNIGNIDNNDVSKGNNVGLKENDAGLKENDVGLKENDAGLKENDASIRDINFDDKSNIKNALEEQQLAKNEQNEKQLEKKVDSLDKQLEKWKEFGDSLDIDNQENDLNKEQKMTTDMIKVIEQNQRDAANKLKTLKKSDWDLRKKKK